MGEYGALLVAINNNFLCFYSSSTPDQRCDVCRTIITNFPFLADAGGGYVSILFLYICNLSLVWTVDMSCGWQLISWVYQWLLYWIRVRKGTFQKMPCQLLRKVFIGKIYVWNASVFYAHYNKCGEYILKRKTFTIIYDAKYYNQF